MTRNLARLEFLNFPFSFLKPCSGFMLKVQRSIPRLKQSARHRRKRSASSKAALTLGGRPYRVGVIGGGPAGFYAASRLLSLPGSEATTVDLFELLPIPFGLARFGVAPDHPEVKVSFTFVWLCEQVHLC